MVLIYFALFESATMIPLVVCEGKHHELEMRFEIDVPKKYCGRILYHSVPICTLPPEMPRVCLQKPVAQCV